MAKRRSELTDELWLTEDGRLFTSGPYTGPARYTVATGEHVPVPTGADGTSGTAVADVAMDRDRTRVAVLTTDRRITVVDAGPRGSRIGGGRTHGGPRWLRLHRNRARGLDRPRLLR
ncbi:hypothetical protein ACFSSF_05515 [Dietzia aerolata]|uniref:hypothetical protein n=1 Tax=Dietzia aerolata TaxID=595984 RepID=UPI00363F9053